MNRKRYSPGFMGLTGIVSAWVLLLMIAPTISSYIDVSFFESLDLLGEYGFDTWPAIFAVVSLVSALLLLTAALCNSKGACITVSVLGILALLICMGEYTSGFADAEDIGFGIWSSLILCIAALIYSLAIHLQPEKTDSAKWKSVAPAVRTERKQMEDVFYCPNCAARQRRNRSICFNCGYNGEPFASIAKGLPVDFSMFLQPYDKNGGMDAKADTARLTKPAFCPHCGRSFAADANFCAGCGKPRFT